MDSIMMPTVSIKGRKQSLFVDFPKILKHADTLEYLNAQKNDMYTHTNKHTHLLASVVEGDLARKSLYTIEK